MRLPDNHSVKWRNGNLGIGFCLTAMEKVLSKTVETKFRTESLGLRPRKCRYCKDLGMRQGKKHVFSLCPSVNALWLKVTIIVLNLDFKDPTRLQLTYQFMT